MLFISAIILFCLFLQGDSPDPSKLPSLYGNTILLDNTNTPIENDNYAKIEEISPYIKNAFIALEDKRFYSHFGIDPIRIAGAALKNIKSGSFSQGGSTITCQLVKNTHLSNKKTLKRKYQESKLAFGLEKNYTKDEILEMYLNVIYFGKGIYGIKQACLQLYGKKPDEITPLEAASLAATVANPARYSVLFHYANNLDRSRTVLSLMNKQGYLSDSEFTSACASNLVINYNDFHNNYAENYRNLVLFEYQNMVPNVNYNKYKKPFFIYTKFDAKAQHHADRALLNYANDIRDTIPSVQAELLLAENKTGAIIAAASLGNHKKSFSTKRQPGSLLKPFIYASAIEEGRLLPDSPILDEPIHIDGYSPTNYHNRYSGWTTAKQALSQSSNTCAVKILQEIGIQKASDRLQRCGIPLCEPDKTPALALGGTTYGSSVQEICNGYLCIANGGMPVPAKCIRKITDANGNVIYKAKAARTDRAFSKETAYLTTTMLKETAKTGTAKQLSPLSFDIAAKTGTVAKGNGNSDAWCAGYTTEHTFVCRYSANTLPNKVTGGNHPTKTVRSLLRSIYSTRTPMPFSAPNGVKQISVNKNIKDNLHILIPYEQSPVGARENILSFGKYTFLKADPNELFLRNFTVQKTITGAIITFDIFPNVTYQASVNGNIIPIEENGIKIKSGKFPLIRLDIVCSNEGQILHKATKIIRL